MTTITGPDFSTSVANAELGEVPLTHEQKQQVVYSKYESQDPMLSDTMHAETWDDQFVEMPSIGIEPADGCIITVQGRPRAGEVGIDRNGEIIPEEAADQREESSGTNIPRFRAYDFRVVSIEKTDGPAQQEALHRTHDQQKAKSEENMFDSIARAMTSAVGTIQGKGNLAPTDSEIQEYLQKLHPGPVSYTHLTLPTIYSV